jgi:hypothetical protein
MRGAVLNIAMTGRVLAETVVVVMVMVAALAAAAVVVAVVGVVVVAVLAVDLVSGVHSRAAFFGNLGTRWVVW